MCSCISITWSYGYFQDSFLSVHTEKNITIFHGLERLSVCDLITRQQSCFLGRTTASMWKTWVTISILIGWVRIIKAPRFMNIICRIYTGYTA